MGDYGYLVSIAIIMLSTKILGDLTKKVSMPQVVGALLAGVIIGPTGLGIIAETDFIAYTAEIGVIMLMFLAGLDTDINEIKKNSVAWHSGSVHRSSSASDRRNCVLLFVF